MQQDIPPEWQRLMEKLAVPAPTGTAAFTALAARYKHPARTYHTLAHAQQVVARADELAAHAEDPEATRLAAWFHDAIYEAGADDNEERSAAYARETLGALPLAPGLIAEVERLIQLTTTHEAEAGDGNGQVLVDADLAILGAPPPTYAAYARAIREEYSFAEPAQYRRGRLRVLRRFLARPHIYYTPAWRREREPQARRNLHAEIARLRQWETLSS